MSLDPRVNGESCVFDVEVVVVSAVDVVLALVGDFDFAAAAAVAPTPIAAAELCPSCLDVKAILGVAVVLPKYASSVVLLVALLLSS